MKMQRKIARRSFLNQSICGIVGATIAPGYISAFAQNGTSKRFELSLHQASVRKLMQSNELELSQYPKFAKEELGISNIEFDAAVCSAILDTQEKVEALRKESERRGVKNRVVLCGGAPALDAPIIKEREAAIYQHLEWAKLAEHLGCEFIRVQAATEGNRTKQLDHAANGIGSLADKMKSSPISVLIENTNGFSRDPAWLIKLVERIDSERVNLLADFANFDGDIYDGMKQLLPFTKSLCTKSWEFDAEGNETKIDFQRMMNIIKESEFRGCIAIEYLGDDPVSGIKKTAALINKYS